MTDIVTPTQADGDALIEISRILAAAYIGMKDTAVAAEEGLAVFARHRLAAEATQAAEIARLKQELQLYLPPAPISGDYGQGWAEGQAWMINCIRGEDAFDKAVPLTHALVEKDDEIARLRSNGKRAAKAIDEFIEDLRMRASLDKRNIDPDGTVAMPIGNGVLYRLREACAALSAQPSEQEGGE